MQTINAVEQTESSRYLRAKKLKAAHNEAILLTCSNETNLLDSEKREG